MLQTKETRHLRVRVCRSFQGHSLFIRAQGGEVLGNLPAYNQLIDWSVSTDAVWSTASRR
jgi:hypothetical protein